MTSIRTITIKTIISIILLFIGSAVYSFSISTDSVDYPVIGKPCPDFTLTDVQYYDKQTITNEDLKGKWFMLDFWGEYCIACIKSFPKLNQIQKEFSEDFQIILIGVPYKERVNEIQQLYEKHRETLGLEIPIAYEDKLAQQFHAFAYPHQVIVDPEGIVRYITTAVMKEDIQKIINKENPALLRIYNATEQKPFDNYDKNTPLLLYNNGGEETDYFIRSVFTYGSERLPPSYAYITDDKVEIMNFSLHMFYKYAFTGELMWTIPTDSLHSKVWPQVIVETKDTSNFTYNFKTKENLFAYSATVSDLYRERFGNGKIDYPGLLKKELEAVFPYIATMEKREMPCNILYISEENLQKIKTNSDETRFQWLDGRFSGFDAIGLTMVQLVSQLIIGPGYPRSIPLLYEGPDIKIDLKLKSGHFDDRILELKELGFELRKEKREMDVIVIRDK